MENKEIDKLIDEVFNDCCIMRVQYIKTFMRKAIDEYVRKTQK